jgi:hypothetical protein
MEFRYGTVIAVAAALFFYLRLIILQRQKLKRLPAPAVPRQGKKRSMTAQVKPGAVQKALPGMNISSPPLLGTGIVIILFGAVLASARWFPANYHEFWWIPVSLGILLMSLAIH